MQSSDISFYAPHCSGCFNTFSDERAPRQAACGHLFCSVCVDPHQSFLCPYDKCASAPEDFRSCEDIQAQLLRLFSDDFDEVLETVYAKINTTGVLCRFVRASLQCEDLSRCRYYHGQVQKEEEDLMQSMEPVFPEDELIKDYIVVEKSEDDSQPSTAVQIYEFLLRLFGKFSNSLQNLRTSSDLSSSHYD